MSTNKKISRRKFLGLFSRSIIASLGALYLSTFRRPANAAALAKVPSSFKPSYLKLHKSGELKKRGQKLWEVMRSCKLCPRQCGVDRISGQEGFCRSSAKLEISSYHPHFGEEPPLVGRNGSGTIFLTNCGLRCIFCINWEISHLGLGNQYGIDDMAMMMLALQKKGCHNINLVTPTHYVPHIILAVDKATAEGLRLPLVYNTCGWESMDTLKMLDGIVDVYLPDFKYSKGNMAATYSAGAYDYPDITKDSFLEMQRQVGVAREDKDGIIRRGMMVRHLVMPNNVAGTKEVLEWLASNLPKDTFINLMSQYQPCYKAFDHPQIARRITAQEYKESVQWAKEAGLTNVHFQGMNGLCDD